MDGPSENSSSLCGRQWVITTVLGMALWNELQEVFLEITGLGIVFGSNYFVLFHDIIYSLLKSNSEEKCNIPQPWIPSKLQIIKFHNLPKISLIENVRQVLFASETFQTISQAAQIFISS